MIALVQVQVLQLLSHFHDSHSGYITAGIEIGVMFVRAIDSKSPCWFRCLLDSVGLIVLMWPVRWHILLVITGCDSSVMILAILLRSGITQSSRVK